MFDVDVSESGEREQVKADQSVDSFGQSAIPNNFNSFSLSRPLAISSVTSVVGTIGLQK